MRWPRLFRKPTGPGSDGKAPKILMSIARGQDDPPPPMEFALNVCWVAGQPGYEGCVSWLSRDDSQRLGLPPEAVVAVILRAKAQLDDANLIGSAPFPPFLQACMPAILAISPTVEAAAARFGDGLMPIPDARGFQTWAQTPRAADIAHPVTIGAVEVRGGRMLPGSYQPNPDYRGFARGYGIFGVATVPAEFYPTMLRMLEGKASPG